MRRIRRSKRSVAVGVALITVVLLLATAAPVGGDVGQGGEASGDPIKVMTIGTIGTAEGATTAILETGLAATEMINRDGGVGPEGRPLEFIPCSDQDNPEGARQCALQAVEEGVLAIVGGYSIQGAFEIYPLLEENQIPWIGAGPLGPSWEGAAMAYPFAGGSASTWMVNGATAGEQGCERAGALHWPSDTGDDATAWFTHGLESEGGELVSEGIVGFGDTDIVPPVAAATGDDVDCLMFGMSPEQGGLTVQASQELGIDASLVFYPDAVSPDVVEQTGGRQSPAQDGVTSSWFPVSSDRQWREAKRAVKRFADDPDAVRFTDTFNFQLTWVAYMGLVDIMSKLDTVEDVTGADLIALLDSGEEIDPGGFTPEPIQFAENVPVLLPGGEETTRVFNPFALPLTIKNGKYRCLTPCEFQDMTELMGSYGGEIPSP
jgi:ABC-type branched-subunit amino acid transport system substrate-binding protein